MTPEKAAATAAHFMAGGTMNKAPVALATIHLHAKNHPEWWAPLKDIAYANGRLKGVEASAAKKRARTHCVRGHLLSGSNVEIKRFNGENSRSCKTCRVERHRQGFKASPVLKAKAEAHIRSGGAIQEIITTGPKRLFTHSTFLRLKREDQDFKVLVEAKAPMRFARWRERLDEGRPVLTGKIAATPHVVFSTVEGLVRKTLPWHIRGDVVGSLCEAVLSGEIQLSEVEHHVRRHVSRAFRDAGWHNASLNKTLCPDSTVELIDLVTKEWLPHAC